MKKKILISLSCFAMIFTACEKDNLDGPDAQIHGNIIDIATGELVEQDIINGSLVYFIEQGFSNPPVQSMNIKNDGTYRNDLIFSGDYQFILNKGNYSPLDTIRGVVKSGNNKMDFKVLPYIRIKNMEIKEEDGVVIANFKIQQTTGNPVQKIALFAHPDITVGNAINVGTVEQKINDNVSESTLFTLMLDVKSNTRITKGRECYFRVGALSNAPEAKFNYSAPVKIYIPKY